MFSLPLSEAPFVISPAVSQVSSGAMAAQTVLPLAFPSSSTRSTAPLSHVLRMVATDVAYKIMAVGDEEEEKKAEKKRLKAERRARRQKMHEEEFADGDPWLKLLCYPDPPEALSSLFSSSPSFYVYIYEV